MPPQYKHGAHRSNLPLRRELSKRFGWRCWYCGIKLEVDGGHLDHILPRCRGGSDTGPNHALTCGFCNLAKHEYLLDEFMSWLGYLRSGDSFTPYELSPTEVQEVAYQRKVGSKVSNNGRKPV